ncbi:MAG: hypothetical protein WA188_00730 [Terriglobales bacterium]
MKSVLRHLANLAVVVALLSVVSAYATPADGQRPLTKHELNTLLKNAKTPGDHLRIASYYREEAQRLRSSSEEYLRQAEVYDKNPPFPALESKQGTAFGMGASHCRYWAKHDAEAAAKADAQAALHEDMAKKAAAGNTGK